MPDGPEKTILGDEQKIWLMQSLLESDATYKFVITPGPIVGPDKRGKTTTTPIRALLTRVRNSGNS
jgi:phosphodiesterase/alkaline phosphatase D-like protein